VIAVGVVMESESYFYHCLNFASKSTGKFWYFAQFSL